jgi:hypothetical protein
LKLNWATYHTNVKLWYQYNMCHNKHQYFYLVIDKTTRCTHICGMSHDHINVGKITFYYMKSEPMIFVFWNNLKIENQCFFMNSNNHQHYFLPSKKSKVYFGAWPNWAKAFYDTIYIILKRRTIQASIGCDLEDESTPLPNTITSWFATFSFEIFHLSWHLPL